MTPKVSVIIPVYNAHAYLAQCISSVLNQTLREIEVICVDDDSRDDSLEILHQFEKQDPRMKVLHQENGGAGAARNNGLQYASGEYLSILDCDDFFEPDMLEKAYLAATEQNLDILVFGCDFYDNQSGSFRPCTYSINRSLLPEKKVFCAEDVSRDVFKLFVGWSWDKLFRTEFVREHGLTFQVQRTTNDMLFVFNALLRAGRIGTMEEVFAHQRRGLQSLSVTREKSWMCFYNALTALREEMYKIGCYQRFEQDFKNYCVHFSLWNLNTLSEPTHTILYNKLREEWFRELDLLEHPKDYFYNKREYAQFKSICKLPAEKAAARKHSGSPLGKLAQFISQHGLLYAIAYAIRKLTDKNQRKKR